MKTAKLQNCKTEELKNCKTNSLIAEEQLLIYDDIRLFGEKRKQYDKQGRGGAKKCCLKFRAQVSEN